MRDRPERILHAGIACHDGRRGVVVRYPRSADYFRRALARVSVDSGDAEDPAAKLLAMTRQILAPERPSKTRAIA